MDLRSNAPSALALLLLLLPLATGCERPEENAVAPPTPNTSAAPIAHRESKVTTLPVYEDPTFTPRWIKPEELPSAKVHTIPEFKLTNQLGEPISEATFDSKIYIVDFFFTTCPGICKDMTINMAKLQDKFADDPDVLFLSHSVTPDIDTPEILAAYGKTHGVKPGKWHLATGDRAAIYHLGRREYFIEEDLGVKKSDDDFLHTENFLIIDTKRRIRGIYNGLKDASLARLVADVRTLQKETATQQPSSK